MSIEELQEKYKNVPSELKQLKRWVCYNLENRDGRQTKVPINAITGNYARSNDKMTWSKFKLALNGCIKYNCKGLGFMLGDGIFGVDLDNHIDPTTGKTEIPTEEFDKLASEFVEGLNSYSEKSQSGFGVHIICEGKLPEGRRRKGNVEMYDCGRFFAFTGNAINNVPIINCQETIVPLWAKYVKDEEIVRTAETSARFAIPTNLNDNEILNKAFASKNGTAFQNLYNGDLTSYGGDHSAADMAFCSMLAFWCNGNVSQMDSIFRSSGLMRPKWDEKRGSDTYGNITLGNAVKKATNGYVPVTYEEENVPQFTVKHIKKPEPKENKTSFIPEPVMNIDENGEPIFRIKKNFKKYPYNDTGNAERFYDYFGDVFKYNKEDKVFMLWTGKTWVVDAKDTIRKYANKLIEILKQERESLEKELAEEKKAGTATRIEELKEIIKASSKNIDKISNKSGKDNMLAEFESIRDVAVINTEFDTDKNLLNTESGVVNLDTGEIMPFKRDLMLSKNTNTRVSYNEPRVWKKFLNDIFQRGNQKETDEIIKCLQMALGYSLSGYTSEQVMFIMWGDGSNGKSTYSETISKALGDYSATTASDVLMQQKSNSGINVYSVFARLKGKRYIETGETEEGAKFAENLVKKITGADKITARQLYGKEFEYYPEYKIWMATNKKPIIRGNDLGIWRRIFMFPFIRCFTEKDKDKKMPEKLLAELPEILGWCIQGYQKYKENDGLFMPDCLKREIDAYKEEMDIVSLFITKNCVKIAKHITPVKKFYSSFKNWAVTENEFAMRSSKVEEDMRKKGYKIVLHNGQPCYVGIKLNSDTGGLSFNNYDEDAI